MKHPSVSIVLIHYSSAKNLEKCLLSLTKVQYEGEWRVVIVNNAAKEPLPTYPKALESQIDTITLSENLGFTGGNNAGMKFAIEKNHSDAVILLNDDTTVDPLFVQALIDRLFDDAKNGAVAAKIYFSPGREFHHDSYEDDERGNVLWYAGGCLDWREVVAWHRGVDEVDHGQYEEAQETPFATGCCVAYRSAALKKAGLLDDAYFLYWEDVELSLRLKKHGWKVWYEPQAVIWHDNAGSSGSGSTLHEYYQTRNHYRVGWQYAPLRTKLFLLKHSFNQLRSGSPTVKRAILDVFSGSYGKR